MHVEFACINAVTKTHQCVPRSWHVSFCADLLQDVIYTTCLHISYHYPILIEIVTLSLNNSFSVLNWVCASWNGSAASLLHDPSSSDMTGFHSNFRITELLSFDFRLGSVHNDVFLWSLVKYVLASTQGFIFKLTWCFNVVSVSNFLSRSIGSVLNCCFELRYPAKIETLCICCGGQSRDGSNAHLVEFRG